MTIVWLALPVFLAGLTPPTDGGVSPSAPAPAPTSAPAPAPAPPPPNEGKPVVVTPEGSVVPILVPSAQPTMAPILAPELAKHAPGSTEPKKVIVAPASLSVYDVSLPAETAVTVGALGLYFMVDILVKPTLQSGISCQVAGGNGQCDPGSLSGFDRYAVGRSSREWATFSDVVLATSITLPVLYLGLESMVLPTKTPVGDFAKDLVVVAEAMAVTAALGTILKFSFRRPRPSRYLPEAPAVPESYDSELSLPSGHAAMVAAATTSLTTTIFLRHPRSKVRFIALGVGITLSLLTALARVEAGQHFPTDVITGLVVGASSGFLVPYFHRKHTRVVPTISFNPSTQTGMLSLSGNL